MSKALSPSHSLTNENFSSLHQESLSRPESIDNDDDIFDFFNDEKNMISSVPSITESNESNSFSNKNFTNNDSVEKDNELINKKNDDFFTGIDVSTTNSDTEFDIENYSFENSSENNIKCEINESNDNIINSTLPTQSIIDFQHQEQQQQNQQLHQSLQGLLSSNQYQELTQNLQVNNNSNFNNVLSTAPISQLFVNNEQRKLVDLSKPSVFYSPLIYPPYLQQFSREQIPNLSHMSPDSLLPFATKKMALENICLMNHQAQYKNNIPMQFLMPGMPLTHPLEIPPILHSNMLMNSQKFLMTPNGPVFFNSNNQLLPLSPFNNNLSDSFNKNKKKDSKKKLLKLTKKQSNIQSHQNSQEFISSMNETLFNTQNKNISCFSQNFFEQEQNQNKTNAINFQIKSLFLSKNFFIINY